MGTVQGDVVRVAAVAPSTFRGDEEYRNAQQAAAYVAEAADNGAALVLFPEGYPGPCSGPMDGRPGYDSPLAVVQRAARENQVYVACGRLETTPYPDAYYLSHKLVSPEGEVVLDYRRCQPTPPALNAHLYGGKRHLVPGDELGFARTDFGMLGIVICSELKVPELARMHMLRGVELLLNPVGGAENNQTVRAWDGSEIPLSRAKMDLWISVAQARAVENMMYVVVTANAGGTESHWGSGIVSPEGWLARSEGPGIAYADLDMARLRYLRSRAWREEDFDGTAKVRPILTDPGQHRDRRPELYAPLTEPQSDSFNYDYVKGSLDAWRDYDRAPSESLPV